MARDLIPPPSPAGRPEPDAPRLVELPPEPAAASATGPREREPVGPSPFRNRFGFLLGALAGIIVAAIAVLAIALTSSGDPSKEGLAANWSSWQPSDHDATTGAAEIADHVAGHYHLSDGHQLVSVTGGPLQIQDVPLNVVLRPPSGSIELVNGHGVLYTLNGLGPHGSIVSGHATEQRGLLVRREALELALYSFRYLDNVDMVVALLPPRPPTAKGGDAQASQSQSPVYQALFYRPGDLRPQLEVPLGQTIPSATPIPEKFGGAQARKIDSLTRSNVFAAWLQQAQDTRTYLVLERPQ